MHQLRTETLKAYALESHVLFGFRALPPSLPFRCPHKYRFTYNCQIVNIISVKLCSNHFPDGLVESPSKLYWPEVLRRRHILSMKIVGKRFRRTHIWQDRHWVSYHLPFHIDVDVRLENSDTKVVCKTVLNKINDNVHDKEIRAASNFRNLQNVCATVY